LTRWTKEIGERPAVKRGRLVNCTSGPPEEQLHERHDASDFETKTQDKIGGARNPRNPNKSNRSCQPHFCCVPTK